MLALCTSPDEAWRDACVKAALGGHSPMVYDQRDSGAGGIRGFIAAAPLKLEELELIELRRLVVSAASSPRPH